MNNLRDRLLASTPTFKSELVTITPDDKPMEVEIRQPSIAERAEIRDLCRKGDPDNAVFDLFAFLIWTVIKLTCVPGTTDRIFEDADYDALGKLPSGSWLDDLSEVASKMVNVDAGEVKND